MQHIEEAGVHSGDSACVIPPHSLPAATVEAIKRQARELARELNVKGLMNVQFAIQHCPQDGSPRDGTHGDGDAETIYVLEVNPRASRTVPFVSKATGVPLARFATLVMVGKTLDELGLYEEPAPSYYSVKESVFPFNKFPGVDIILGPEMRSTGEVMGIDDSFAMAFAKSQIAANSALPTSGMVFISVADRDKPEIVPYNAGCGPRRRRSMQGPPPARAHGHPAPRALRGSVSPQAQRPPGQFLAVRQLWPQMILLRFTRIHRRTTLANTLPKNRER
jgi:carbamoyl-phosphate synthase large subunit